MDLGHTLSSAELTHLGWSGEELARPRFTWKTVFNLVFAEQKAVGSAPKFHNLDRAELRFRFVEQPICSETQAKDDEPAQQNRPQPNDHSHQKTVRPEQAPFARLEFDRLAGGQGLFVSGRQLASRAGLTQDQPGSEC